MPLRTRCSAPLVFRRCHHPSGQERRLSRSPMRCSGYPCYNLTSWNCASRKEPNHNAAQIMLQGEPGNTYLQVGHLANASRYLTPPGCHVPFLRETWYLLNTCRAAFVVRLQSPLLTQTRYLLSVWSSRHQYVTRVCFVKPKCNDAS